MRIVVPYANRTAKRGLNAELQERFQDRAEFIDVSGSDHAYFDLLSQLWEEGEDFLVIEHDNLPTLEQIADLESCAEGWCTYEYSGTTPDALGCVRFRREFIQAIPNLWEQVGEMEPSHNWGVLHIPMASILKHRTGGPSHRHGKIVHDHQLGMLRGRNRARHPYKCGDYTFKPGEWVTVPEMVQRHWCLLQDIEWEWIK